MSENIAYKIDTSTPEGAPEAAFMEFPADAIPGIAGEIIQETRAAFGVESDIPGGLVLGASAASIGKGLLLKIKGESTPSNLFLIIAGTSGCGKSKTRGAVFAALDKIDAELVESYSANAPERETKRRQLEAEQKSIEAKPEAKARLIEIEKELQRNRKDGVPPHIMTENVTSEKLAILLHENREQMAVVSADGNDVIQNMTGRYSDGREDENLYLKGYSGDPFRVDRVNRGCVKIAAPCITFCISVTPDVLRGAYANERFLIGGMLPRILPILSHSEMPYDDGHRRAVASDVAAEWECIIRELFKAFHEAQEPRTVTCTPEAEEAFRAYYNSVVARRKAGELPECLAPFYARTAEQAKRIALNLHALKHGANAPDVLLDERTARDAVRLAEWFFAQQELMLAASIDRAKESQAERLESKLRASGGRMTLRDLKRAGFEEAAVRRIIGANPFRFQIQTVKPEGGGRESEVVELR